MPVFGDFHRATVGYGGIRLLFKNMATDAEALSLLAMVAALAVVFSLLPGAIAYRRSLQDGLTVRV